MTRKDYVKFAATLKYLYQDWQKEPSGVVCLDVVKSDIADIFAADNPRFDRGRFYRACEPEEGRKK